MDFDSLGQTLDCGQCFRWEKTPDGAWEGAAGGNFLRITRENLPEILGVGFWRDYFDMGTDYEALREEFGAMDPVLREAARYAPEIRILRQDPWEALGSFLLSQCNNIKRIKGMVARLCREYGEPCGGGFSAFPRPEALAELRPEDLRRLGFGYRAEYLVGSAREVASGSVRLEEVRGLPIPEARAELMKLPGVGPKVADCALLYGLHRLDAFPMDVWMKRAMAVLFPGRPPESFGPYAGIAQQYLFHYSRNHPELFR